jgi:hypothetical protein
MFYTHLELSLQTNHFYALPGAWNGAGDVRLQQNKATLKKQLKTNFRMRLNLSKMNSFFVLSTIYVSYLFVLI